MSPPVANHVGFKVLNLLSWLIEAPLSRADIVSRFESLCGTRPSADTLELYLSTLRQAGCVIKRPTGRGGGRYRLLSHTFGTPCDSPTWEALSKIWDIAEETLAPQDMLIFYRWLLRYFNTVGNNEAIRTHKAQFMAQKRITSLLAQEDLMLTLCQYCETR